MEERDPRGAPQGGKSARSVHVRFLSRSAFRTKSVSFSDTLIPLVFFWRMVLIDHSKGNKSTLITRIQEHEENSVTSPSPPVHTPGAIRSASTQPKKTSQAVSPGIPLAAQPNSASSNYDFLAIKLPNLSQSPPNAPVQVVSLIRFIFAALYR